MTSSTYHPPGFLSDFDAIPGQLEAWSHAVSTWFDATIATEAVVLDGEPCQYYNQVATQVKAPVFVAPVVWNALPGTLRNRYGRRWALERADHLYPLSQAIESDRPYFSGGIWETLSYRPQDEYCEWRTERDSAGRITRITFVSEPPEYWQAFHGDAIPIGFPGGRTENIDFPGDRRQVLELYREHVGPHVEAKDLVCPVDLIDERSGQTLYRKGEYNPYNRWNTTDGIMHLSQPNNSLSAEIQLGGDATILYEDAVSEPLVDPDALVCGAGFGGVNRTSDPTIGSTVNQLAWLGFKLTLADPVGLYMDHINLAGISKPNGEDVDPDYFRVVRGTAPGFIERAVFEVPPGEGLTITDLRVGGVPIRTGSQVAERIVVRLRAQAAEPGSIRDTPRAAMPGCCEDPCNGNLLTGCRPLSRRAFTYPPPPKKPLSPEGTARWTPPGAPNVPVARSHASHLRHARWK